MDSWGIKMERMRWSKKSMRRHAKSLRYDKNIVRDKEEHANSIENSREKWDEIKYGE